MAQQLTRLSLLAVSSLILSACSTTPKPVIEAQPFQVKESFHTLGKLGIRSSKLTESANFIWQQQQDAFSIELLDPFGRRALQLKGDDQNVEMQVSGDDQLYKASSPEELMQALLGWQVPVRPAKYWIQGKPAPGLKYETLGPAHFVQSGWDINLRQTRDTADLRGIPRKIQLSNGELKLTLVFSEWSYPY